MDTGCQHCACKSLRPCGPCRDGASCLGACSACLPGELLDAHHFPVEDTDEFPVLTHHPNAVTHDGVLVLDDFRPQPDAFLPPMTGSDIPF